MKKYIAGLLTGLLVSLTLTTFAAVVNLIAVPNPFPILVNGLKSNIGAYSIGESTYIKLADLKVVGVDATFDGKKKQIEIKTATGSTAETGSDTDISNSASTEDESVSKPLEVTSTRTMEGLTVYTAGGKEYVYRYDIIAALQKKNDSDDSKYGKYGDASYYLDLPLDSAGGLKDVILTVDVWGTNEDVKPVNLSEPIKITNIMVDKQFEPRLSYDKQLMPFIKLDDYEKYIKPILDSDKTLEEIYNSHAK